HLEQYDATYPGSGHTTCTALARSFADIGDIVRGKDLYLGNKKKKQKGKETEREKLEKNLQKIFGNIYNELTSTRRRRQRTNGAEERYGKDPEFFKLREDWWNANRAKVWEAITCAAKVGDTYFRPTCSDSERSGSFSQARNQCRCEGANVDPPTYFDYVPQYLRWFEEWAEDFCRKKNKKLEDAIKKCRGQDGSGEKRYCDLNGYDCKRTFSAKKKYRWDHKCTGCFLSCSHFRTWIDNQKEQFLKQKNKYQNEISGNSRKKRSTSTKNYKGYDEEFYEKLREDYGNVEDFLEKLSKEGICQKPPEVGNQKADAADFKKSNLEKTFDHTEYCQACPLCGVKKEKGTWVRKDSMNDCPRIKLYKPINDKVGTPINFLYSGDGQTEIAEKLKKFCRTENGSDGSSSARANGASGDKNGGSGSQELYQYWKCYQIGDLQKVREGEDDEDDGQYDQEVENAGGLCILQKTNGKENVNKQKTSHEIQKTFNPFFYYWVVHMLKDSIHWRTEKIKSCINNTNELKACKNNKKCNSDCDCFKRWVKQKGKEWGQIKVHFKTQDIRGKVVNGNTVVSFFLDHDELLEGVLDKGLLLESLQEAYGNAEDIKHIKKLLQETDVVGGGEHKTTIDFLLKEELNEAEECLKKQKDNECKPQEQATSGLGRSADPGPQSSPAAPVDTVHEVAEVQEEEEEEEEEEDEDEEDEEEEEGGQEALPDETEVVEETVAEVTDTSVDVCNTVAKALTDQTNLTQACQQKYARNNSRLGWKCIPSGKPGDTTGGSTTSSEGSGATVHRSKRGADSVKTSDSNQGSICVPPRRRKLYVGKLEQWAEKYNTGATGNTQGGGDSSLAPTTATSSGSQSDPLLTAFVESAAVETFFLWHRYKEEKKPPATQNAGLPLALAQEVSHEDPQTKLDGGDIPEEFKRQMFYTLADYKDILEGKNDIVIDKKTGDKDMVERESKIKDTIQTFFQNGDSQTPSVQQPSGENPRKTWWEQHGKDIWKGMVCALTYKENGEKKIVKDGAVYKKFFGENSESKDGKPVPQPVTTGTQKGTYQEKYEYSKVVLKEEDESGEKRPDSSPSSGEKNPPKLSDFVKLPPFFRWLHEWGSDFCGTRKHLLEKIKEECTEDGGRKKCSGDGENCNDNLPEDPSIFPSFNCPGCATPCGLYKRWIKRKKDEFLKQKEAYDGQKTKCKEESKGGDNGFCETLETNYTEAKHFLQKLGSCKKDKENVKDELDFDKPNDTFRPATNCDPCSEFKINCKENGKCSDEEKRKCNGKTDITANDIQTMEQPTEDIGMLVSDNDAKGFDGLQACQHAGIFEGIRKEQWKCGKVCGYNVCKPKNVNGQNGDGNQIIIIRALFKIWLEYFLEDYNKIKKKLKPCIENGNASTCINGCNKKCNCVEEWIKLKKEEWEKIKKHYKKHNQDNDMTSLVRNFLEELQPQSDVKKATGREKISDFESSCHCNGAAKSENSEEKDVVVCLLNKLDRLKKKIGECTSQSSGSPEAQCDSLAPIQIPPEEPFEEEEENPVTQPNICPEIKPEPEAEVEDDCKPDVKEEEEEKEEEKDKGVEKVPPPKKPEAPATPPPKPEVEPPLKTALVTSTLAWSVGIGFAAFTYFYLK
ncbi:hypothetical protein PFAG_06005, partial [Plasmodium falciparum Santa Lucia]